MAAGKGARDRPTTTRYWPDYVSLETLAERLDCLPDDIDRLVESGHLPGPVLIGYLERWDFGKVHSFISKGYAAPTTSRPTERAAPKQEPAQRASNAKDPFITALDRIKL